LRGRVLDEQGRLRTIDLPVGRGLAGEAVKSGAPVVGDRAYGGAARVVTPRGTVVTPARIALHCARVTLPSMRGGSPVVFESPVPGELTELWEALGGARSDWAIALK
jgi:hypothetical protein